MFLAFKALNRVSIDLSMDKSAPKILATLYARVTEMHKGS